MSRFKVEIERRVTETVEIFTNPGMPSAAINEAVEKARDDNGDITHREIEGEIIVISWTYD
jgi:hypothetical protein